MKFSEVFWGGISYAVLFALVGYYVIDYPMIWTKIFWGIVVLFIIASSLMSFIEKKVESEL